MRSSSSLVVLAVLLGAANVANAQGVEVQGEATVTVTQPVETYPEQPPPPGYGQPEQPYGYPRQPPPPVYGQPVYQQPQPYYPQPVAQPHYVERSHTMTGLWVSGVIVLPVSYVLTWASALFTLDVCSSECRDWDYLWFSFVPVVGPWFMLAQNDPPARGLNGDEIAGAVLAGIAQAAGVTLIILGLAIRETVSVPSYALDSSDHAPELSFSLLPADGGAQLGVSLTHF